MSESPGPEWIAERRAAIRSTLGEGLLPEELKGWFLEDRADGIWLQVDATGGEYFELRMYSPDDGSCHENLREFEARLRSDLQDWIAESRFGWGQQRLV